MALARLLLAVLLLASACDSVVTPTATPTASTSLAPVRRGVDMTDVLLRTKIPPNDPFALTRGLRGRDGTPGPFQPARATPLDRPVGAQDEFWIYNERTKTNEKVTASVRLRTDHAYWYVQTGITPDPARLQQTALEFEGKIYPTDRATFGAEWTPGIDADPRLTILIARIPDVGGYFSAADELPRWVNPFSNEREMIYVNVDAAQIGTSSLSATLAHEFSHMIEFNKKVPSSVWFNEGQAQIAELQNGSAPLGTISQFLRSPDTQLTDWHDTAAESGANYGHAFLFLEYLAERFGGTRIVRALMEKGVMTPADIDAVLEGTNADEAYLDFVAAIALFDQADAPAPYRFPTLKRPTSMRVSRERAPASGEIARASVHQYAARYYELSGGTYAVDLTGPTQVRLLPTDPHSGKWLWWSNRADGSDMRLTRGVDLRGVDRATLAYWTWFDVENSFDYAYVEASTDGGKTWRTLRTPASTDRDPNGTNLGLGITGRSGGADRPTWVEQTVDLTAFARKEILLRFEYVTDQALNKDGVAIDDLTIPEIGWRDDAESEGGWTADGFVRSSNLVNERFVAQVVSLGAAPTVSRTTTNVDGVLHLDVLVPVEGALLAVSALAIDTTQAGAYELRVTKR